MRFSLRTMVVLALALALSSSLRAEEGILVVHVEDVKGNPVSGVTLAPKGDGAAGSPTDKLGKTRLRLPPATRSGHWITLQVLPRKGGSDWVFVSPWNQRTLVPSFANESENFVEVVLGERGSRDLLASDQAIRAVAARTLEQLGPRLDKSEITDEERKRVLEEQAAAFGLKPEEVGKAVRTWGAKVQDPFDAGLAALYEKNYSKAEEHLEKSLNVRRQERDEAQGKVAEAAFFLGNVFYDQGQYREAAEAYKESLENAGEDATILSKLGIALLDTADLQGAGLNLKRALELNEKILGAEHPDVAISLNNLAELYRIQGRYTDAMLLLKRALRIREKILGADHPDMANSLNSLAALYQSQGQYSDAKPLYQRALMIQEKTLGPDHTDVATTLNNLAALYFTQGQYSDAEPLYQRALSVREKALGAEHPNVAISLNNLAEIYRAQDRYVDAMLLYKRSLKIQEKRLGTEHPDVANSLNNLALLYDTLTDYTNAELLLQRSLKIREKALGAEHPDVAISLNNLAMLYSEHEKLDLAEELSSRAVVIAEKSLGPCHPNTARMLENRAAILETLGQIDEAHLLLGNVKKIHNGECTNPSAP